MHLHLLYTSKGVPEYGPPRSNPGLRFPRLLGDILFFGTSIIQLANLFEMAEHGVKGGMVRGNVSTSIPSVFADSKVI